jgi:NADPH2:quinone reductase
MPFLCSGALNPVIGTQLALDETASAIRSIDERRAVGKVLVRIR